MAAVEPSRTRRQPSARPVTPAQKQRQRDQIAREKTEQLEHQMFERTVHRTRLALARQKGRADALKEAGIKPQTPGQAEAEAAGEGTEIRSQASKPETTKAVICREHPWT